MSILSNVPYSLNENQTKAAVLLERFVLKDDHSVFILSGYAGTGKTTLLRGLIGFLVEQKIEFNLMASTGRAAQVLTAKSGSMADTVHSSIYTFDDMEVKDDKRSIRFKLRRCFDADNTVYIVDESSMIADKVNTNEALLFEDGRLLSHLFTYIGKRKVIFVGDPAQLPPINSSFSAALNKEYLEETYHRSVTSIKLTEIMRYDHRSGIAWNGANLRLNIESKSYPQLSIKASGYSDVNVVGTFTDMIRSYLRRINEGGYEAAAMISYTNKSTYNLNCWCRERMGYHVDIIVPNEWLQVVQNNYKYNLANGQHIRIEEIDASLEKHVGITFRSAHITYNDGSKLTRMRVKLMEDLLYNEKPALSEEKEVALLKDFFIRCSKKGIKKGHPMFLELLRTDEWINALRVKYGYAITCHKAQGGEWDHVFILPEFVLLKSPREFQYRWMYTAVTRTSAQLILLKNDIIY